MKVTKGKSAALFDLQAKVLWDKKAQHVAVMIEHPVTEEMLFDADKIKSASIDYLKDLFQNSEPKKEYENDFSSKPGASFYAKKHHALVWDA